MLNISLATLSHFSRGIGLGITLSKGILLGRFFGILQFSITSIPVPPIHDLRPGREDIVVIVSSCLVDSGVIDGSSYFLNDKDCNRITPSRMNVIVTKVIVNLNFLYTVYPSIILDITAYMFYQVNLVNGIYVKY